MKNPLPALLVILASVSWLGCSDEPELVICEGGACERQEQCEIECEDVCGDPDFGSFRCIEGNCECQCFFGCRADMER